MLFFLTNLILACKINSNILLGNQIKIVDGQWVEIYSFEIPRPQNCFTHKTGV